MFREDLDRIEAMKFLNTAISGLDLRKPGSEEILSVCKGSAGNMCKKKFCQIYAAAAG